MKPALELTSVPGWTVNCACPDADLSGRSWTVVGFGSGPEGPAEIVATWTRQIAARHPEAPVRVHIIDAADDEAAAGAVSADLVDATVGWRLMIAGPSDACLRLRAHAVRCDVADDEITVATTDVAVRDVHCVHCGSVTRTSAALEDVIPCRECGRNLVVYYHVSRRLGAHLGFMVDAERLPAAGA